MNIYKHALFTFIFPNDGQTFQIRFYESLLAGSIPVVLSTSKLYAPLPFQDTIDWRLAAIRIPRAKFPEIHFILRSISLSDSLEMRRMGRFYLENYLLNTKGECFNNKHFIF